MKKILVRQKSKRKHLNMAIESKSPYNCEPLEIEKQVNVSRFRRISPQVRLLSKFHLKQKISSKKAANKLLSALDAPNH